jgi:anti-sigma factor RsiW
MDRRRCLNEYLDGRMPPERREAFEAELSADPELAAELAETQRVLTLLRSVEPPALPDGLTSRVMSCVAGLPTPRRRPAFWTWLETCLNPQKVAFAVSVAGMAVLLGFFVQPQQVRLQASDQAFINQCLADYHSESVRLTVRSTGVVETPGDSPVEVLGAALR